MTADHLRYNTVSNVYYWEKTRLFFLLAFVLEPAQNMRLFYLKKLSFRISHLVICNEIGRIRLSFLNEIKNQKIDLRGKKRPKHSSFKKGLK